MLARFARPFFQCYHWNPVWTYYYPLDYSDNRILNVILFYNFHSIIKVNSIYLNVGAIILQDFFTKIYWPQLPVIRDVAECFSIIFRFYLKIPYKYGFLGEFINISDA